MTVKNIKHVFVMALIAICGQISATQAIPLSTMDYQGALFTLEGKWTSGSNYEMTYWANFDNFEGATEQPYLKAIDWKWEGAQISAVSLVSAPGDSGEWMTQTHHQIGTGDLVGCELGGGSNAVCTEFTGEGVGLSTATTGDVSWVFDISFKHFNQIDLFLEEGLRNAFVDDSGLFAAPILACDTFDESICSDPLDVIAPVSLADAEIPIPGVPALLAIGLTGLLLTRKGRGGCLTASAKANPV